MPAPQILGDLLSAAPDGDATALLFGSAVWSYRALDEAAEQRAKVLWAEGVRPGDVVCQIARNHADLIITMFAIFKCGAIYAALNPSLSARELSAQLQDCRPKLAVADDDLTTVPFDGAFGCLRRSELAARPVPDAAVPRVAVDERAPAVLFYTSGTTGRSKGVLLSHANVLINARQVADRTAVTAQDRLLHFMPIFHASGLCIQVVLPFLSGASLALLPRFDMATFWRDVTRFRPTYFHAVPTILVRLLEGEAPTEDISFLRFVRAGAAPLPSDLTRRFEARFGRTVVGSYGLTEATCTVTMNPPDRRKIGSAGTALDGLEVRIVDDHGVPLAAGATGEVVVRGPTVMCGYLGLPSETGATIRDGWLHTGDLGHLDEEGYLFLTDRKKDLIIRGGENISPREIEEVLHAHPSVSEASVVGLPDDHYGEIVAAFVVLRDPRFTETTAAESVLLDHCRTALAPFKVPARLHILETLPKNAVGKISKATLREHPA